MNELLARLLRLQSLPDLGQGVSFGFERPLPAWAWVGVAGACALLAVWAYRRLEGPRWARVALASFRALILLTLVLLLTGPRLVESSESTERDWALVLVDRSASLAIADAPGADPSHRRTREQELREAIERSWPMWRDLSRERQVVWLGFDAGAYDLATHIAPAAPNADPALPPTLESVDLGEPKGRRTSLGLALDQALRRAAARPLSGVVIISDGRSLDEPSRAALRFLQADHVPVHTLALGSASPIGDFAIRRVDGPGVAFTNDAAPVTVEVERIGGAAAGANGALVRLIDTRTGITLAEQRATFPDAADANSSVAAVTLITNPGDAGKAQWAVEIVPDSPDLIPANNRAELTVELTDRPMRVLFIDGYPRWEQRYLKNILIREKSIVASDLLLAPDRRYTQEGDTEIDSIPDSPEKWAEYDAVILGDVEPGVFTEQQLMQLRDHVALRGAGLLWIAGSGATPNRWFDTPLADLLPMSASGGAVQAIGEPVVALPAPAAARLGVLRLSDGATAAWPEELSDPNTGWSLLRWAQRIDPAALKPAAEPLALASIPGSGAAPTPLVLSMRFGAGRSLYVATDETWRWRFGRGEKLPERFWVQMIRLLGRESLARSGRPANLTINPRAAVVEQPVRIDLELLDQSLIDEARPSIALRLERAAVPGDDGAALSVDLTLRPDGATAATSAGAPGHAPPARRFSATWVPPEPGAWTAKVVEPGLTALNLSAEARVSLPDDELRRPEADHALLARLSTETGGAILDPASLSKLPDLLPNRRVRLLRERFQTLWDTPAALLLAVFLLSAEWVGRRVIRLI